MTKVIILKESARDSILSDSFTYACTMAVIGLGFLMGSAAAQWLGFILFFVICATKASGRKRLTPAEARAELDRIESLEK